MNHPILLDIAQKNFISQVTGVNVITLVSSSLTLQQNKLECLPAKFVNICPCERNFLKENLPFCNWPFYQSFSFSHFLSLTMPRGLCYKQFTTVNYNHKNKLRCSLKTFTLAYLFTGASYNHKMFITLTPPVNFVLNYWCKSNL